MEKNVSSNPLKPGDIVSVSWGSTMRIVQFFEVTRTTPKKVGLRELEATEEYTGFLSGFTSPILGKYKEYDGSPYSAKNGQLFCVKEDSDGDTIVLIPDRPGGTGIVRARKWDGNPKSFNYCD